MSSGFEADTALISCLLNVIDRAMRTKVTRFQSTQPRLTGVSLRSASKSLRRSTAARVADRLNDKIENATSIFVAQRSARPAELTSAATETFEPATLYLSDHFRVFNVDQRRLANGRVGGGDRRLSAPCRVGETPA